MSKVILIGYIMRIKERNTSDYRKLRNFDGNSSDFGVVLYNFLKDKSGVQNIEDVGDQKTIFYGDLDYYNNNKNFIKCKSYVGTFGNRYDVVNHKTGKIDYNLMPDDSYAFPLNLIAYIPDINTLYPDIGILVFEKFKNHGAKGLFETQLNRYFSKNFHDYTIEIEPVVPEEIITYLEKGKVITTEISSLRPPKDLADKYSQGTSSKKKVKVALTITNMDLKPSVRNLIVSQLRQRKHVKLSDLLTGYLIDPNEIKFSLEYNNHMKKIVLKEEGEVMTPGIDVTDQVKPLTHDGYPDDTKLYSAQYSYLNDIRETYNKDK